MPNFLKKQTKKYSIKTSVTSHKSSLKGLLFLIGALISSPAFAVDGMMLNYGVGMSDALIQYKDITGAKQKSIGVFWNTDTTFQHGLLGYSELEFEAYAAEISKDQTMNLVAVRPILNFWESSSKARSWYWQFGIGLSYFDSKRLDPIEFSSNAQFATIFGLGFVLDDARKHRLTMRYNHYSNGYLSTPNQGLDTFTLDWHIGF
ncbi:acyloxyacyl hydrolase [Aliikangiella coralliicola]|uniref:Acyloxyacyl hydrolase n=1 Tax=Aliikangiella coralliicola TaxID=2592383 RepID=A0A545UE30_9GAMM|nr:acyloxyacyl hydrolase [Aliikangiella coralliicola]TQV87724.1 acyloxyacyl hydrolase [Aliikangiella coralliicola]